MLIWCRDWFLSCWHTTEEAQESWAYYVLFFSVCDISAAVNVSIIFTIVQVPLYQTSSKPNFSPSEGARG